VSAQGKRAADGGSSASRASEDLAAYGDLSAFARPAEHTGPDVDDQAAIDLVMGGDAFLVGDGTLDAVAKPLAPFRASAAGAGESSRARPAVKEALARLETLAGEGGDERMAHGLDPNRGASEPRRSETNEAGGASPAVTPTRFSASGPIALPATFASAAVTPMPEHDSLTPFEMDRRRTPPHGESFDTRRAEMPTYARVPATPDTDAASADDGDDVFAPRTSSDAGRDDPGVVDGAFDELHEPAGARPRQRTQGEREGLAAGEPPHSRPAAFARYRSVFAIVGLALLLVGLKYLSGARAHPSAETQPASPLGSPALHEHPKQGTDMPRIPVSMAAPRRAPSASAEHSLRNSLDTPEDGAPAPVAAEPAPWTSQLEALTERVKALEMERDSLRAENVSLKSRRERLSRVHKASTAPPAPPASMAAPPVAPAPKASAVQYLGTFLDSGEPVAEVLFEGALMRVKRGDRLGGLAVDAVGEMSVTVAGTSYSP
jgi:hypothetical protein